MNKDQFLIVGLGNPGPKYSRTWHNCGFMALEILSQRHHFNLRKIKFKGLYNQVNLFGKKVIFLMPQTFMNLSGESVRAALDYFKIPLENCLVIYDDIDIETGKIRIRQWGSAGSHNGMRSIIKHLNSDRFPRIRVGIGPQPGNIDIVDYVMQNVPKDKQELLFEGLTKAADAVEIFLKETLDIAMNRLNGI
ncbi:MAG: aminoacyl-tRNA hydrolase [Clostridiaceae bacterium]|nr:aminoacyl-tRNA hydrolase [Clostridiaceae bacterium]